MDLGQGYVRIKGKGRKMQGKEGSDGGELTKGQVFTRKRMRFLGNNGKCDWGQG